MTGTMVLTITLLVQLPIAAQASSEFCEGFKQGYITGHKQALQTGQAPAAPQCPAKPMKRVSDPKSDHEFGYTIGYRQAYLSNDQCGPTSGHSNRQN